MLTFEASNERSQAITRRLWKSNLSVAVDPLSRMSLVIAHTMSQRLCCSPLFLLPLSLLLHLKDWHSPTQNMQPTMI